MIIKWADTWSFRHLSIGFTQHILTMESLSILLVSKNSERCLSLSGLKVVGTKLAITLWSLSLRSPYISILVRKFFRLPSFFSHVAASSVCYNFSFTLNYYDIPFTHRSDPITPDSSYMTYLLRSQSARLRTFFLYTISLMITHPDSFRMTSYLRLTWSVHQTH